MDTTGTSVLVKGLIAEKGIKADRLKFFFQRKDRGGPVDRVEILDETSAIVKFKEHIGMH